MDAALSRAETLEDENEALKEEIEKLRAAATSVGAKADPDAVELAKRATRVLEQLDVLSQRRPRIAPPEQIDQEKKRARDREERAEIEMSRASASLVAPQIDSMHEGRSPREGHARRLTIALCALSFALGFLAHWLYR